MNSSGFPWSVHGALVSWKLHMKYEQRLLVDKKNKIPIVYLGHSATGPLQTLSNSKKLYWYYQILIWGPFWGWWHSFVLSFIACLTALTFSNSLGELSHNSVHTIKDGHIGHITWSLPLPVGIDIQIERMETITAIHDGVKETKSSTLLKQNVFSCIFHWFLFHR